MCVSPLEKHLLKQWRHAWKRAEEAGVGGGCSGVMGVGNEWAATFFLPVPNGLTTGSSKAAQMSVEEDLARGEEEGGGAYRNTEAARHCDESTGAEAYFDN